MDIEKFKKLRPNLIQRDKIESDIFYARDFATLAGVDSYGSAYDIWLKRKFGLSNKGEVNSFITAGLNLESVIAKDYYMKEREHQYILVKGYEVIKQTETFRIGGIPDFLLLDKRTNQFKGLEIKTAQADWEDLPLDYMMQCQMYMHILDIKEWDLAVLVRGHEYKEYQLTYDPEMVKVLLDMANDFYTRYIVGDEEPYDPLCYQTSQSINLDERLDYLAEERDKLKTEEKRLSTQIEIMDNKIKELIGTNKGVVGTNWKATYQTQSRTSYDIDAICEEYEIDKKQYAKLSEFRVLRVTGKK